MKTKSFGAGAMFMKRRSPDPKPELCHFYDSSAALVGTSFQRAPTPLHHGMAAVWVAVTLGGDCRRWQLS